MTVQGQGWHGITVYVQDLCEMAVQSERGVGRWIVRLRIIAVGN